MKTLGKTLKEARELIPFTLRQVEESTGISNAYLSQLENDKIKKPSANVLYKLANIYGITLDSLLSAAGIIDKNSEGAKLNATTAIHKDIAFYAENFSEEEQKQVIEFVKYLRFKKNNA